MSAEQTDCTCQPLFAGHVVEHPDCPRGRVEIALAARAAATPVEDDGDPIHDQMPSDRHRNCKHPDCAARAAAPPVGRMSADHDYDCICDDCMLVHSPPSPDPVAGLREALDALDPNGSFWDHRRGGVLLTNAGLAKELAALLASDKPDREAGT